MCGMSCKSGEASRVTYVATIHPVRAIVSEIVGGRGEVIALVPSGASPHTYEPRPADASVAETALALFYVDESLDGWAARLPARVKVATFQMVDEPLRLPWMESIEIPSGDSNPQAAKPHDHHGKYDSHYWSDPEAVEAVARMGLVERLSALDPEGRDTYKANALRFVNEIKAMDAELKAMFGPLRGRAVISFHMSWNYFFSRYGIRVVGAVEPQPGQEPTAQHLKRLIDLVREQDVKAILVEPQLPRRPAEVIAEATGTRIAEIDPNGGVEGRMTYRELIMHNANALRDALQ